MTHGARTAIVAVAAVAALGPLTWRSSVAPPAGTPSPPPPDLGEAPGEGEDSVENVAVTSDGGSFVPVGDRDRVQAVPPRVPDEPAAVAQAGHAEGEPDGRPREPLG